MQINTVSTVIEDEKSIHFINNLKHSYNSFSLNHSNSQVSTPKNWPQVLNCCDFVFVRFVRAAQNHVVPPVHVAQMNKKDAPRFALQVRVLGRSNTQLVRLPASKSLKLFIRSAAKKLKLKKSAQKTAKLFHDDGSKRVLESLDDLTSSSQLLLCTADEWGEAAAATTTAATTTVYFLPHRRSHQVDCFVQRPVTLARLERQRHGSVGQASEQHNAVARRHRAQTSWSTMLLSFHIPPCIGINSNFLASLAS